MSSALRFKTLSDAQRFIEGAAENLIRGCINSQEERVIRSMCADAIEELETSGKAYFNAVTYEVGKN